MRVTPKSLRKATLSLIGTIIGAGVFGLPIVFSQVGFVAGSLLFWFMALVTLATHLLFAEVILAEKHRRRLPGYARRELGRVGFWFAAVSHPLQLIGTNLIYLVLGAGFLSALVEPWLGRVVSESWWILLFCTLGVVVVGLGLKFFAKVEAVATWILIISLVSVVLLLIDRSTLAGFTPSNWSLFFAPFGIFLFALSGVPVIGEIVEIVERSRRHSILAITIGTLAAALLSWLFGVGVATALHGQIIAQPQDIAAILPTAWQWILPTVGFLAVITSYLALSQELKATFVLDFRLPKVLAWIAAMLVPLCLTFIISRDFVSLVSWIGTFFGGLNGALIGWLGFTVLRRQRGRLRKYAFVAPLVIAVYLFGMAVRLASNHI